MAKKLNKNSSDARLKHSGSESRRERHQEDRRVTQARELSDDERLDEFRKTHYQSALPDLPRIEGYHVCWLTTTNPRDSIHARVRMGYEPIKKEDVPGWEYASLKTGEWAGCIGVNEMVAFKLPMHLYEAYMKESHHTQPLEEEEKLNRARENAEEAATGVARRPVSFELEEGTAELGQAPEPPPFSVTLGERDSDS